MKLSITPNHFYNEPVQNIDVNEGGGDVYESKFFDEELECKDCSQIFVFSAGEQGFCSISETFECFTNNSSLSQSFTKPRGLRISLFVAKIAKMLRNQG